MSYANAKSSNDVKNVKTENNIGIKVTALGYYVEKGAKELVIDGSGVTKTPFEFVDKKARKNHVIIENEKVIQRSTKTNKWSKGKDGKIEEVEITAQEK